MHARKSKLMKARESAQTFSAKAPLKSVARDLLGPFLRTPRGHTHLLVITDRYRKLTKTVALGKTDAYAVSVAFVYN